MVLTVTAFAGLAERIGQSSIRLDTGVETMTIRELKERLSEQFPAARTAIEACYVAKNLAYAQDDDLLNAMDEIALIPPVSGG